MIFVVEILKVISPVNNSITTALDPEEWRERRKAFEGPLMGQYRSITIIIPKIDCYDVQSIPSGGCLVITNEPV